ncbi:MAG: hypothetical protein ACYTGR_19355 [Planctomycetota bacterium]|jgi:hypothetical protein
MLVGWWAIAIGRYLRMPHAIAVSSMLGVMCYLLGLSAMSMVGPLVNAGAPWDILLSRFV